MRSEEALVAAPRPRRRLELLRGHPELALPRPHSLGPGLRPRLRLRLAYGDPLRTSEPEPSLLIVLRPVPVPGALEVLVQEPALAIRAPADVS